MSYLYKNNFEDTYEADVGKIAKVLDPKSKFNTKQMYVAGTTFNGYCYKDYNNFKNNPDEICYIAECGFDDTLFVDYVTENKNTLINQGGISTYNSIRDEVINNLEYEEYYYEYEKDGAVYTIEAKNFDKELINQITEEVFNVIDWQTSQAYIYETDWREDICEYYNNKFKEKELEL